MKGNRQFSLLALLVVVLLVASLNDMSVEAGSQRRQHHHQIHKRQCKYKQCPSHHVVPPHYPPPLHYPPPPHHPPPPHLSPPPPHHSPPPPHHSPPPPHHSPPPPRHSPPPPHHSPPPPAKSLPPPIPAPQLVVSQALKVGFYDNTDCSSVESVVTAEVTKAFQTNPGIAGQLLRLYFHDCFGNSRCDASLLITKNKDATLATELASGRNQGIRGLAFIDVLKTKVVAACKNKKDLVSCADIIALAARDAVALASKRAPYNIPTGRLDGLVSKSTDGDTLPAPRQSIASIVTRFAQEGFSAEETVVLSGAHTIGQARCQFFEDRLYNWRDTGSPDPSFNTTLAASLRKTCTNKPATVDSRVFLDQGTPLVVDKDYFVMLANHHGILETDQKLLTDPLTKAFVQPGLASGSEKNFYQKFEAALIKMGNLGPLSGTAGNIRHVCSKLN